MTSDTWPRIRLGSGRRNGPVLFVTGTHIKSPWNRSRLTPPIVSSPGSASVRPNTFSSKSPCEAAIKNELEICCTELVLEGVQLRMPLMIERSSQDGPLQIFVASSKSWPGIWRPPNWRVFLRPHLGEVARGIGRAGTRTRGWILIEEVA